MLLTAAPVCRPAVYLTFQTGSCAVKDGPLSLPVFVLKLVWADGCNAKQSFGINTSSLKCKLDIKIFFVYFYKCNDGVDKDKNTQ